MTRKSILAWTLAWTLTALLLVAWVALAEAGPKATRKAIPAVQPPTATDALPVSAAQLCRTLGEYAATVATSRDAGLPLSGSLALIQKEKAARGMESFLQMLLEGTARNVYRSPALIPAQVQQTIERVCVETELFQDVRLRY
jgi:hypothetical protein